MAVNNSLTKSQEKPKFSAVISSEGYKKMINNTLRDPKRANRFVASITSAVVSNQTLQECEPSSIISAALLGESLELSPSAILGQYYMVPFNDNNKGYKVAQFQLGYKGYIQLALRSGQYKKLNVLAIKEGELINYDPLFEEIEVNLIDDEEAREKANTIGYFAMFEYNNGFRKTMYWSKAKMEAHALEYSQGYKSDKKKGNKYTFWSKDFDGMAFKTMLRQLISKWGIMSIEMQDAYTKDMGVIHQDGAVEYVDNEPMTEEKAETIIEDQPQKGKNKARLNTKIEVDETSEETTYEPTDEKLDDMFGAFPNEA
ncbi:MAG: recombinase RecT [Firmicutes bacterium]|nr:recombinase RecT [Bacillota bacterium]